MFLNVWCRPMSQPITVQTTVSAGLRDGGSHVGLCPGLTNDETG